MRYAAHFYIVAFALLTLLSLPSHAKKLPEPLLVVPFEFENNRIRLEMVYQGIPLQMLLDSGASTTILFDGDNEALSAIPALEKRGILFPALDEKVTAHALPETTLELAGMPIVLEDIVRLDDKTALRERLVLPYHGILGREFFYQFTIKVDPEQKTISLYPKGTNLKPLYRNEYKLYLQNGAPHIRLRNQMPWEDDSSMKEMLVDTGYPGAVVFWDSLHYRKAVKLVPETNGTEAAIVGRASFNFGKIRFHQAPVYLGSWPPKQLGKRDGLIGATILNHLQYAIDLTGKKLWFRLKKDSYFYSRQFDGTFYPPNDERFIISDFRRPTSATPTHYIGKK